MDKHDGGALPRDGIVHAVPAPQPSLFSVGHCPVAAVLQRRQRQFRRMHRTVLWCLTTRTLVAAHAAEECKTADAALCTCMYWAWPGCESVWCQSCRHGSDEQRSWRRQTRERVPCTCVWASAQVYMHNAWRTNAVHDMNGKQKFGASTFRSASL